MIKAIIFDMDGVIAMTSHIQSKAESKVFAKNGIHIAPEEIIKRYSGFKDIDMFHDVLYFNKINMDAKKMRQEKWKIVYKKISEKGIPEVTGIIDLINKLKSAGYILGIGSTTNLKFIQDVLKKLKILRKFKIITSGDEVTSGKPNPEIFLLAAEKLKLAPVECLVIEDAPNGVKAAKRAGMKCIAITTTATKKKLKDADKIIDSFEELRLKDIKNL